VLARLCLYHRTTKSPKAHEELPTQGRSTLPKKLRASRLSARFRQVQDNLDVLQLCGAKSIMTRIRLETLARKEA